LRKKAWIPLILLGLGSLFVGQGLRTLPIVPEPASEAFEASPSHETSARSPHTSLDVSPLADRQPHLEGIAPIGEQNPPNADRAPTLQERNLDRASSREIRQALEEAIRNQQRTRSLFVSPGIVEAVANQKRVRIIFETDPRLAKDAAIALLGGSSGRAQFDSLRLFPLLDRGAAVVGPQALLHLVENPGTGQIELDMIHRPSLAETIPIIGADLAHQQGYDGDGFAVAVLDTGVDPTHPMYADRLIEEACFSAQSECPNGQSEMFGPGAAAPCSLDGCDHGTRVAGIVLGDEPGGGLTGVAPHADLIAIQIFSDVAGELGAYSSDILAGLQHVLGLAVFHQIASANLSIGGDLFTSEADCDRAVASQFAAVALLRAANVLCLSNVIGVGSTSDFDEISSFSNSASFLRLLAPGEVVESSVVGGGTDLASGTSMAASHVAGGIAAIREAIPSATADEIENALALSGVPVFDARNGITRPRIQVPEAITFLETNGPPPGGGNGGTTPAATTISGDGGGGTCGLVGIEPFLVLGLVRLGSWRRFAERQKA